MMETWGLSEIPSFSGSKKIWPLQAVDVIEKFMAPRLKTIKVSSPASF